MIQRTGQVVVRMLENVQQVTIGPLIRATIAPGTVVYTDEYNIYHRLDEWGYEHRSVCHAAGEFARDDDFPARSSPATGAFCCISPAPSDRVPFQ